MGLRYKQLRLKIPSLYQINKDGKKGGQDWCGRTSAAMIYNYYVAARAGGMDNALGELAINQRKPAAPPYDLVLPDGTPAVNGYFLLATMQRAKPEGWAQAADGSGAPRALYPVGSRSGKPDEAAIRELLAPLLNALEMFNPALFYSGLSSSEGTPRHIVVISGYRVGPGGALWLHIDDPGSQFRLDGCGEMAMWSTATNVTSHTDEQVLIQLEPETHDTAAGRRYWLKASRLFDENHVSTRNDLWCDHIDRPGMCIYYNDVVPEPASVCVETSATGAGLPVQFVDEDGGGPSAVLPLAWANARASGAPYPLGGNRAWHNGIHFQDKRGALASKTVSAAAPGEIVFVRFPERGPDEHEDAGAVLVRHGFDPATLRLLDPRRTPPTDDTIWLYSLSMNLLGGADGAAPFLAKLDHGQRPEPRDFLPATAACSLFGYDADGCLTPIDTPYAVGSEVADDALFELSTTDGPHLGLWADDVRSNLNVWEDGLPQPPLAPTGGGLGLYDAGTGELIQLDPVAEGEEHRLVAECNADHQWKYVIARGGMTHWVHTTGAPGLQLGTINHCVHQAAAKGTIAKVPAGFGAAFLRERSVPITVQGPSGAIAGRITHKPPAGGELVWCAEASSQPAMKPKASSGDLVSPQLIPCVAASAKLHTRIDAADTPTAWSKSNLRYYNPATGRVLDTNLLAPNAPIVADVDDRYLEGGKYAKLQGYAVDVAIRCGSRACAHDRDELDAMLALDDAAWPLLTCWDDELVVYTATVGEGTRRSFPEASKTTIEGKRRRLSLREGPCKTSGKLRAWPDLTVVAGLNLAQYPAKCAELAAAYAGPNGDTLGRLTRGESRLFGAQLTRHSGWEVSDGNLVAAEGREDPLRLFVEIGGRATGRFFPEHVDNCDHPILAVAPTEGLSLRVVSQFRSGKGSRLSRALVEVSPAAPTAELKNNDADLEAWDTAEAFVDKVRDAIDTGDVVELAAMQDGEALFDAPDHPFSEWRMTGLEPVGTMGTAATGVHFEMFAGENLLPSDGPNGLWREIKSPDDAKPLTTEFFADVVSQILADPRLADLARAERDATGSVDGGRDAVPIPAGQWRKFCSKPRVDRALSRIISVHPTEWAIDWEEVAKDSENVRWLKEKTLGLTAGWWPTDIALKGLDGDAWTFYHPLRLLEWLTTGVDARIELSACKTTAMHLELGGEAFEMSPSDADEEAEVFRIRTVVGDRAECVDAVVVLEGVDTANPRIPVSLERGELLDLWLCEPSAQIEHQPRPLEIPSATPAAFAPTLADESTGTVHLLADTSPHLAASGHSRASFVVEARYNLEMPDALSVSVDDPAFSIERIEILGAEPLAPDQAFGGTEFDCSLKPRGDAPATFTMHRTVSARIDIVCSESAVGKEAAEAGLVATFSGGDLLAPAKLDATVATRVVADDARGQDVAKLQHFLHQIHVDSGACYRGKNGGTAVVDGHAGDGTALAIWRFVLQFCAAEDWDRSLAEIKGTKGSRALSPFEVPAEGVEAAAAAALEEFGHPEVGPKLVAEIVAHYGMPSVLPAITLSVAAPVVDPALEALVEAMGATGRSTMIPVAGSGTASGPVNVDVAVKTPVPGDASAVDVTIVLGDDTPFVLVGDAKRTLATLLGGGIELTVGTTTTVDAKACQLTVQGPGDATMGTVRLGGTRDLLAGGSNAKCLDGAQVQLWLSEYPMQAGVATGFYSGDLDGEFGSGSGKALTAFQKQVAPGADYATLVGLLAAGPTTAEVAPAAEEDDEPDAKAAAQ